MSSGANADLRKELGEAKAALHTKEAEYVVLVQERDRKLADQVESHKAALQAAQDSEAALKAEYETEAASWSETRRALDEGFGRIEDLIDGKPPSSPLPCPLPPGFLAYLELLLVFWCRLLPRLLRLRRPKH